MPPLCVLSSGESTPRRLATGDVRVRLLFVLKNVPETASRDGMSRWVFNIVRELVEHGHVVDIVGLMDPLSKGTGLVECCANTHFFPPNRHFFKYWRALCGWDFGKIRTYDKAMHHCLSKIAGSNEYEMVFFCGHGAHAYVSYVRASKRIIVPLDANNGLAKIIGRGPLGLLKKWLDDFLEKFSLRSYSEADCVLVVSEADRRLLVDIGVSKPVFVIPLGVDFKEFKPSEGKWDRVEKSILFTGILYFPPNVDAIEYLVREIYEAKSLGAKGIKCTVAGRRPPPAIRDLCESAVVELVADPPDLRPVFDRAFLYVAPMRTGLGMKTKVLEAMAMGLPVVGTPLAFNGIEHPQGVVVCESPDEFAVAIVRFASNMEYAQEMGEKARTFARDRFNTSVVVEDMFRKVQELPGCPHK